MLSASKIISLTPLPNWSLWAFALVGIAAAFAAIARILPRHLRRRQPVLLLAMIASVIAQVMKSHSPRTALWFIGLIALGWAVPLAWMGPMPADMPSARDPVARAHHPQYAVIARRGRIATLAAIVLCVVLAVGTGMWVAIG